MDLKTATTTQLFERLAALEEDRMAARQRLVQAERIHEGIFSRMETVRKEIQRRVAEIKKYGKVLQTDLVVHRDLAVDDRWIVRHISAEALDELWAEHQSRASEAEPAPASGSMPPGVEPHDLSPELLPAS